MLKKISLKFGPTPKAPPVEFSPGAMTVIVGPNNSGKSLFLQELDRSRKPPSPPILKARTLGG